ncbi:hypothetical protein F751_3209 [Auxenochlorella protothecoides]|uniref:Uncharacterized protein n=1 Tax=Auxenochlorella protothecoides TaxID=3075 RepID=A0A087SFI7_AUXPR|nr:hypothetical protein F751_3209 [Auxenochlorella protothecoides]KFM24491.1 hypothetical protein F751_3209 [Auxenochlorella protothecoides]
MVEAGVQAELESLRARLAQSELDKAALQSDVEMLCLQTTSNTTFNSSSVLQERIRYTDKELSSCRAALAASQAQASSLGEDLRALKAAHRDTGARLRDALDRSALLDRELAFYQTSSARAVADRDRTAYEAEGLRERTLALETRLEDAEGHAATQGAARLAAEEREAVLRAEVAAQKVSALLRLSEAEGLLARYKERVASLAASLEATRRDAAAGAPSGNDSAHSSPSKPATSPAKGRAVPGGGWWGRSNSLEP